MSSALDHWVDVACLAVWLGIVVASAVLYGLDILVGAQAEGLE